MMVIVLVKQVPDPRSRAGLREDGTIDRERVKAVMNPYDKCALEAALRLKDGVGAKIAAVSMGPPRAEDVLREALAMGADEAVLLTDRRLAGSDTLATSYALSEVIRKLGPYDLILCGMETTDGNTGQVGPEVAEHLGIPHLTYVESFEVKEGYVEAKRLIEGGYEILRVRMPALLTVTNTMYEPRDATFLGVIRALKEPIKVLSLEDVGIKEEVVGLRGSPTKIRKVERASLRRAKCIIKGGSVEEMVENLLRKLEENGVKLVMGRGEGG